jgi:hypothetical protein
VRAAAPPRPRTVTASIGLWAAATVAGTAAAVLTLLNLDVLHAEVLAQAQQQFPTVSAGRTERVVHAVLLVLLGSWGFIEALVLGCALTLFARRRRARVVARLVLLPLWLLGVFHGAFVLGLTPMPVPVVQVGALVLGLAAIVVMFLPSGNDWFAGRGAFERGVRP